MVTVERTYEIDRGYWRHGPNVHFGPRGGRNGRPNRAPSAGRERADSRSEGKSCRVGGEDSEIVESQYGASVQLGLEAHEIKRSHHSGSLPYGGAREQSGDLVPHPVTIQSAAGELSVSEIVLGLDGPPEYPCSGLFTVDPESQVIYHDWFDPTPKVPAEVAPAAATQKTR
jgi:hypothetical protein